MATFYKHFFLVLCLFTVLLPMTLDAQEKYYNTLFPLNYGGGDLYLPITVMLIDNEVSISIDMITSKTDRLELYYVEEDLISIRRRLLMIADKFEELLKSIDNTPSIAIPIKIPETLATWYLPNGEEIEIDELNLDTFYTSIDDSSNTKCIIISSNLSGYSDKYNDVACWGFISPIEIRKFADFLSPVRLRQKFLSN